MATTPATHSRTARRWTVTALAGAVVVGLAAWGSAPVSAASGLTPRGTFTLYDFAGGHPGGIASGPDGALWFTDDAASRIGRITADGTVTSFSAGLTGERTTWIARGPDGAMWFTEGTAGAPYHVGRITTGGQVTEYSYGISGQPVGITAGPDGAVWFTEANGVARIATDGQVTEHSAGVTPGSSPADIVTGPDGALWFTEYLAPQVGRITTDGQVTEYSAGITGDHLVGITSGPDGALWFTEGSGAVGRITTTGEVTEYPAAGMMGGIVAGPDGALWFSESGRGRIGRITTDGHLTDYLVAGGAGPLGIAVGPDLALWFADPSFSRIGRVTAGFPGAPTQVAAVPADRSLLLSWGAPADAGMNAIGRYRATATPGGRSCLSYSLACAITGLANGTLYTVVVVAENGAGVGPTSAASSAVAPRTVASSPRSALASPRSRAAVVSWLPSTSTGGAAITSYRVTAAPGGRTCTAGPAARACTVSGLTNRSTYRFSVSALNAAGASTPALTSLVIAGAPTEPRGLLRTFPAARTARVAWSAPASTGSGRVTSYQVRWSWTGGRTWTSWSSTGLVRAASRSRMARGSACAVQVRALNGSGAGPWGAVAFTQAR